MVHKKVYYISFKSNFIVKKRLLFLFNEGWWLTDVNVLHKHVLSIPLARYRMKHLLFNCLIIGESSFWEYSKRYLCQKMPNICGLSKESQNKINHVGNFFRHIKYFRIQMSRPMIILAVIAFGYWAQLL